MTLKNLKSWGVMTTTKGRGLEKEDEIRVLKAIRYDREMEESLKATLAKSSQSQSLGIANHQLPTAYNDHFLKTKHSFFHTNKKKEYFNQRETNDRLPRLQIFIFLDQH